MAAPSTPAWARALRADPLLALVVGLGVPLEVVSMIVRDEDGGVGGVALSWVLVLADCAVLAVRYRWPVSAGVATLLIASVYYPLSDPDGPVPMIAFIIVLYALARTGQFTAALTLAVVTMLTLAYTELIVFGEEAEQHVDPMSIMLLSGWFVSVIALGHAMRVRQAFQREAEQRALAAERERDVRARSAAAEERLRIARELHDVLGHNISLISVQSSAALHRSAKRPGETAELVQALTFVRETSKEALRELRATLGVLRQVDEETPTAPVPGLERLPDLVERARATGLHVATETTGTPAALPPQISLAAYRIVQESLTNITRHAPDATRAAIHVAYAPGELRVTIEDDGDPEDPVPGAGTGISGMTERARALGGDLTAERTPAGFRVTARLPFTPA